MSSSTPTPILRFVAFQVVASTPAGEPVYSVADIIDALPRYNTKLLRSARKTAGPRGYVLVGRAGEDIDSSSLRIGGLY